MRTVETTCAQMRDHGYRVTPQRECILRHLAGNVAHPTVDALHAAVVAEMPTVSLKTVYQTVHDLDAIGAVRLLDLGTGSVRVDPNVESAHHHVVCSICGEVRDVLVDTSAVAVPSEPVAGFAVDDVQVLYRGRCAACARRGHDRGAS